MPPTIVLVAIAVLGVLAVMYGYRTLTAVRVVRSLPSELTDGSSAIVDGAPVAVTGQLVVDQPVERSDAIVEETIVGAYRWRARLPDNTNSDLTIQEWG